MTELTEDEQRVVDVLYDSVERGQQYFRARNIAAEIELSAKQVGALLPRLSEKTDDVTIEKWGRSRSTTWRVELG